jgi:rubrerythrin
MNDTTATNALKQALELEQQGRDFYRQAAEKTSSERGKTMFRQLAEDEVKHYQALQRQLDALESGKGWIQDTEGHEQTEVNTDSLFPPDQATMRERISGHASDIDALHVALDLENEAYNLYREAAESVADPAGKQLYRYLAGLERAHFDLLMLNYEELSRYGQWLGAEPG